MRTHRSDRCKATGEGCLEAPPLYAKGAKAIYTLRCTQKLLTASQSARIRQDMVPAPTSTTALGDWYAHRLIVDRQHLAMCVSARSRLCVLTTARDLDGLPMRLYYALVELLRALDVPQDALTEEALARERREMADMRWGLTTGTPDGRSVLGSINDYGRALHYEGLQERSLTEWNLHFSKWICGPLKNAYPREAACRLLQEALAGDTLSAL